MVAVARKWLHGDVELLILFTDREIELLYESVARCSNLTVTVVLCKLSWHPEQMCCFNHLIFPLHMCVFGFQEKKTFKSAVAEPRWVQEMPFSSSMLIIKHAWKLFSSFAFLTTAWLVKSLRSCAADRNLYSGQQQPIMRSVSVFNGRLNGQSFQWRLCATDVFCLVWSSQPACETKQACLSAAL